MCKKERIEHLKKLIKENPDSIARIIWVKELDNLLNHSELKKNKG